MSALEKSPKNHRQRNPKTITKNPKFPENLNFVFQNVSENLIFCCSIFCINFLKCCYSEFVFSGSMLYIPLSVAEISPSGGEESSRGEELSILVVGY